MKLILCCSLQLWRINNIFINYRSYNRNLKSIGDVTTTQSETEKHLQRYRESIVEQHDQ